MRNAIRPPLDRLQKPPFRFPRAVWITIGVAIVVLAAFGVASHIHNGERREANIQAALLSKGYGQAVIKPMRGATCWRARHGFQWKTETKQGWACAGPRDEVVLHEGAWDGSWP
jgi:hypothetical protein